MNKDSKMLAEAYDQVAKDKLFISKLQSLRGYDHVHWSIVNDKPLDKDMGTTSSVDTEDKKGSIFLLGRASDGRHYRLYGPVTPKEYKHLKALEMVLDVEDIDSFCQILKDFMNRELKQKKTK